MNHKQESRLQRKISITTLMAESKELKSLLKVKESEKAGLKLNI